MPPWAIAAVVVAARPLPVAAMAFTAAKAPHLLRRFPRIDRLLTAVSAHGDQQCQRTRRQ
jgi:hypothetical protein